MVPDQVGGLCCQSLRFPIHSPAGGWVVGGGYICPLSLFAALWRHRGTWFSTAFSHISPSHISPSTMMVDHDSLKPYNASPLIPAIPPSSIYCTTGGGPSSTCSLGMLNQLPHSDNQSSMRQSLSNATLSHLLAYSLRPHHPEHARSHLFKY